MRSMQDENRETVCYYVQWFGRGKWLTPTDELNSGGYATKALAALEGIAEAMQHAGPPERWPATRIVRRVVTETVVEM